MRRTTLNFLLDIVLAAVFAALAWLVIAVDVVFPAPTQADGWTLWGMGYDRWARIRLATTAAFAVLVLLHVMLHWSWLFAVAAKLWTERTGRKFAADESSQTLVGVGLMIVALHLLGFAYLAASYKIEPPGQPAGTPLVRPIPR